MTSFFRQALRRLRAILARGPMEAEMQDEMRQHLERATERYRARGMSDSEAQLEARREFGNRTSIEEEGRDARGGRWIDALAGDVRFALRYFNRHKATVAIVIAVLTLGTGANTLFFSVYRDSFMKPAKGIPDDPAHARLYSQIRFTQTGQWQGTGFTFAELTALAERRDMFSGLAGWSAYDVGLDGQAADSAGTRAVDAHFVTPNYFSTLGVVLSHGRSFAPSADAADLSAVMNHAFAERLYGTAAAAVGRRILVNETPVPVIAVANERLEGVGQNDDAMVWLPMSARPEILRLDRRVLEEGRSLSLLARLAPGATHEEATAFARHVVNTTLPDSAARVGMARTAFVQKMTAAPPWAADDMLAAGVALALVGGMILLIGWLNVSSLMVAAAVARRHEIAVRLSLGASRKRLLGQLVTESTILAIAGGVAGLAAGTAVIKLIAMADGDFDPTSVMPDGWTLLFVGALSVVTGIIFGLSPALHATRAGVANALRDSGAATSTRARLQRFFVGTQIVLSQPMLVVLGVILSLMISDFEPHSAEMSQRVVAVHLRPLTTTGAPSQRIGAVDALIPRLRTRADVAGAVQDVKSLPARRIVRDGVALTVPDTAPTTVAVQGTAPGWFDIVGIPIVAGRDVQPGDSAGLERNVVIGSDVAQRLWPAANPLGRRLASAPMTGSSDGTKPDSAMLTVVGVYDATKALPEMDWGGPAGGDETMPRVYTAHGNAWRRDRILVRTRGPAEPWLPELNRVLRAEIPSIPVTEVKTLAQVDDEDFREAMRISMMAGAGGLVALLLASLGLFGVVSLAVQQRTREIGIRLAVGARPSAVTRMFLASGVRVSAIALLFGIPLSFAAVKIGVSLGMVFGPSVNVPLLSAATAAILVVVAVLATWAPARRASRVDPATTLRSQ
jgi:predicted permease